MRLARAQAEETAARQEAARQAVAASLHFGPGPVTVAPRFTGARARLERAITLIALLRDEIEAMRKSADISVKPVLVGDRIVGMEAIDPQPPIICNLLIGEVLYHLRSALDNTVYDLATYAAGPGGPRVTATQFPMEDDPELFEERTRTWLKDLKPEHVDVIRELQPFRGVEWTAGLQDLSNADKHRYLAGLITDGEINGRLVGTQMQVETTLTLYFHEGGAPVIETLELFQREVSALVDLFDLALKI